MKNSKKLLALALVSSGLVLSACGGSGSTKGKYTYRTYASALGTKWDPNTWETNADQSLLSYLQEGFVSMEADDTSTGKWQWTYELAESIEDVSNIADLVKYGIISQELVDAKGYTDEDVADSGYVYEIKLNKGATWEEKKVKALNGKTKVYGGTEIKADDYIESFKILLDPARENNRANLYWSGESAVVGGMDYYYQGKLAQLDVVGTFGEEASLDNFNIVSGKYTSDDGFVYIALTSPLTYLGGNSLSDYVGAYGAQFFDMDKWNALVAKADDNGFIQLTEETAAEFGAFLVASAGWGEDESYLINYLYFDAIFPEFDFSKVGLYKVDDYTLRYVLAVPEDKAYFYTSCTSTWLVHPELYQDLSYEDESTGLLLSKYNTSAETTISYGPYKMVSYQDGKQAKFTQNEKWWRWEKNDDGRLVSKTHFKVDGEYRQQYQTTDIVIDVLKDDAAKLAFLRGKLNDYAPTPAESVEYAASSQLYKEDESYTMSLFFDTNLEDLQKMDAAGTNTNGVVLSNAKFRKAMSLAFNRADWVKTTEGYKPAYSIMNNLYYYDFYEDPSSQYRASEPAMKAIVELYGVEYGEGKQYATLKEAYDSITGYNLEEARALFAEACQELVNAGLYHAGDEIKFKVAWKKGELETTDQTQVEALNGYLTEAMKNTGFGKITLTPVGNLTDRYGDVGSRGVYAIGYGAWGGAILYPFRGFRVYMDPEYQPPLHEGNCWDPSKETLTLTIDGENYTMSYQAWSNSMIGNGPFASASNEIKLEITAQLEKAFLELYYRIPLAGSTVTFLLGYQQHYYTEDYNIAYGFGGFRLMIYDYDDYAWNQFVKKNGGTLNYK